MGSQLRAPKEAYKNRNGFTEIKDSKQPPESQKEAERLATREIAQLFIDEMGSYFPSPSKLNDDLYADQETLATLKTRIADLTARHKKTLAGLHAYRARRMTSDAVDRYLQKDDMYVFHDLKPGEPCKILYDNLDAMYKISVRMWETEFNNIVENYRYDYLKMMAPLWKRRAEMERLAEAARIEREAQFPQTIGAYQALTNKTAKLRVARFLMADEVRQEQMRTESRWAWRQTEGLIKEYRRNPQFEADIKGIVEELGSRDPRSRKPYALQ